MAKSFLVDPQSALPLHRQLYEGLRTAILSGRLRPGERLPATRALAEQLALSRATVSEAYGQLQAEGYLQGKHGSGTYVAPTLPDQALTPARHTEESRSMPPRRLSAWGRRMITEPYQALSRSAEPEAFRYDFRPHRIAQDSFPWDAWRAAVDRALSSGRTGLLAYPPTAGHPELIDAVAAHVARYRAVSCSPQQIVIVNGSQQGLNLLGQLLLEAGDRVAVEDPGYPAARLAFEARGLDVSRLPVDGEGMMVEVLAAGAPQRLVHVTPSHQDPTGATLSLTRRLQLLEIAERWGSVVVEDDYDSEFRYEGRPVESLQGLDRSGLVVYAGTFSKSVLPGLRIGFLVLPPHLVAPFSAAKSLWDSGAPLLEQAALAEFMRGGEYERHIRRMRRLYKGRRDALLTALTETFGERVQVGERHGGLNVLVTLDLPLAADDVVRRARHAGIGLRSAAPYYAAPPRLPTFLLGFGALPEEEIREGVQRLAALIGTSPHPPAPSPSRGEGELRAKG